MPYRGENRVYFLWNWFNISVLSCLGDHKSFFSRWLIILPMSQFPLELIIYESFGSPAKRPQKTALLPDISYHVKRLCQSSFVPLSHLHVKWAKMADNLIISHVIKYQGYYYDGKNSFIKKIRRIADILSVCFALVIRFFNTYADTF